jgi:hypothetical protein
MALVARVIERLAGKDIAERIVLAVNVNDATWRFL